MSKTEIAAKIEQIAFCVAMTFNWASVVVKLEMGRLYFYKFPKVQITKI